MKAYRILASLLSFVIVTGFGLYWLHINQSIIINEQKYLLNDIVKAEASALERRLSRSISATDILAIEIQQNGGQFTDFDIYARSVIESIGGISNLQLAPQGVISTIYPLEGSEKAIGHNILRDDRRRSEAMQAIRTKKITLAGPFKLIQGGVGIIARNPVFMQKANKEEFWGFVSALIYLDELLASTKLKELEKKGYSYTISRIHPDTGSIEVFARTEQPVSDNSQSMRIDLPNANWTLTMSRPVINHWTNTSGYFFNVILGLVVAWLVSYFLRLPEKLQRVVDEKTKELEVMAYYDHLTGLANRRLLSRRIKTLIATCRSQSREAALLYLDLDNFKRINDSMGHAIGDQLLVKIANRLKANLEPDDSVARLGGDDFALLLSNPKSVENLSAVAEYILSCIRQPITLGERTFSVTTSIGITMLGKDGNEPLALIRNADMAMYEAKNSGKNRYSFFNKVLQQKALTRHRIETELAFALKNNELTLHYQPLVDLKTGELKSFEALIRWQHPIEGLIYPDTFISIAEDTSLIVEVGYQVLKCACNTIKQLEMEGREQVIAVNLSPKQFLDPDLLDNIHQIIRESCVNPAHLEVEITESSLMTNFDKAIHVLEKLKQLGVKVAIDDFGTGYSSLSQLKHFPVDKLKIDQSFIAAIEHDENDQKIVKAIIAMAHNLNLEVVAEGIENEQQLNLLVRNNCDIGQGYLFSRPAPIEEYDHTTYKFWTSLYKDIG